MVDLCTTNDAVVLENDIDLVLQQIEVLFDTDPGDVIGAPRFGIKFDNYLYETSLGNHTVAAQISNMISSNVDLMGWQVQVDVDFLAGSDNDILMFRVMIYNEVDTYSKIYKVTQGDVSKYAVLTPVV